jgi:hypothetical protein
MTEQEWLTSTDPAAMLTHVQGKLSPRKLRLFACACARQSWTVLDYRGRRAVVHCEDVAENGLPWDPAQGGDENWDLWRVDLAGKGQSPALQAILLRDICGNPFRRTCLCGVGAPQPDCPRAARIRTPTVLAVARAAYEDRPGRVCKRCGGGRAWPKFLGDASDYGRRITDACLNACPDCLGTGHTEDGTLDPDHLAILADALEDAGADNVDLLAHLRGPGPHVRGCWCVDLLLGKE